MRRLRSRGVVLANVMIMLTVMLLVVTAMLNLTMGRSVMIRKHSTSYEARKITESAMVVLQACLVNQQFATLNSNACAMSGPVTLGTWSSCGSDCRSISGSIATSAKTYSITATWINPAAASSNAGALDIVCGNCM